MSDTSVEPQWHYTLNGNRLGPVPESQLVKMIEAKKLDQDTQVWQQGLSDWLPIRQSSLAGAFHSVPPPISSALVRNGWVWLVAFVPLIDALIIFCIRWYVLGECDAGRDFNCQAFLNDPSIYDTPWWAVSLVNGGLCLLDERRLAKAGYSNRYLPFLALLIVPVYLFVRARRLKQTPWYGFVWIGLFALTTAMVI
jgi:hypothetical protein